MDDALASWTDDELSRVGDADELEIASRRPDGSIRPFVTIWVVRADDELYVRSAYGPENGWFRRALASDRGRIRAGGIERDVTFEHLSVQDGAHAGIDAAIEGKYAPSHPREYVDPILGDIPATATFRVHPAG